MTFDPVAVESEIPAGASAAAVAATKGAARPGRDNRVLAPSKAVAVLVIPFLLVAFGILYVQPARAADMFAWPIKPQLTAMLLGAAYLGGVVFFAFVLGARRWHDVALGFPPVAVFASLLMLTTLLHWGLFTLDRIAGVTWVVIYVVAPPLVVAAWWVNRHRDPGPSPDDPVVPRPLVGALAAVGAAAMIMAALLYLAPEAFVGAWPWKVTALSSRVLAPMICLPGILALGIALDRRWSALRRPLLAQAVALVAMIGALVVRRDDLVGPPLSVGLAWLVLLGSLAGTLALLVAAGRAGERRERES